MHVKKESERVAGLNRGLWGKEKARKKPEQEIRAQGGLDMAHYPIERTRAE